jgi:hypothetical protein
MNLEIKFSKQKQLLTVKYTSPGNKEGETISETIKMEAHSGGWQSYQALPSGNWVIVENPSGYRDYFGLFFVDKQVNDQFKHGSKWRDGIRFGFHDDIGSHGCIMTKPSPGEAYSDAKHKWSKIQKLIRTKRTQKVIQYRNNEIPTQSDNTKYRVTSYGNLTVTD